MTGFPTKVLAALTVICLTADVSNPAPRARPSPQESYETGAENLLLGLVNEAREQQGLPRLERDDRLVQAAQAHSRRMAESRQLGHQLAGEQPLPGRLAATRLRFSRDAENVATNTDAGAAHEGFMHSPGHRANILSPLYNSVGIGVVRSGERVWVTEDFAFRLPRLDEGQVEDEVASSIVRLRKAPSLQRIPVTRLRTLACGMAQSDALNTAGALKLPDVRYAAAYTTPDPADLPPNVRRLRDHADVSRFAVGACFAVTPKNPGGIYWVLIAFY